MSKQAEKRATHLGPPNKKLQTAEKKGRLAETLAAFYLKLKFYRIIARRFKTPLGEIDLIARKGDALVIIEVKARPDLKTAAESITGQQWKRITQALQWRLLQRPEEARLSIRFDAILISGWRIHHIKDAWRPDF